MREWWGGHQPTGLNERLRRSNMGGLLLPQDFEIYLCWFVPPNLAAGGSFQPGLDAACRILPVVYVTERRVTALQLAGHQRIWYFHRYY